MIFLIDTFTWHYYLVIVMQEMQNGGVMIPQLNPLKFKLTQLFTGSKKNSQNLLSIRKTPFTFWKLSTPNYFFLGQS